MGWLAKIFGNERKALPAPARRPAGRRGFSGAQTNRLTADWKVSDLPINSEIKNALQLLRARSRDLALNNDYVKKFVRLVGVNVVGPQGIVLQSKAALPSGDADARARLIIERAWNKWTRKGNASVDGKLGFREILRLAITTTARDGEILIRKVRNASNPFRFALQLIEPDLLDHRRNETLPNGNTITLGVELDPWGKPVAYHLTDLKASDAASLGYRNRSVRVPAEDMIHLFITERVGQARGIPWTHSSLARLRMTLGYEQAELTAARIAASKMGFITEEIDANAEYEADDQTEDGEPLSTVEPGTIEKLPRGMDFKSFDPTHPAGNFQAFMKANLRGAASGLCVSYPTLANDLEGVNYSSIRAGLLEDRDIWMELQELLIEQVCEPVFEAWLPVAILSGEIDLSIADLDRLSPSAWQARRWQWVDPLKDVDANIRAVDAAFKSRQQVIREMGNDPEQVYQEVQEDAEAIGDFVKTSSGGNQPPTEKDDGNEKDGDGSKGLAAIS